MSTTRLDFRPIAQGGDNPTAAFVKLDANDADLDARLAAVKATADGAATTADLAAAVAPKADKAYVDTQDTTKLPKTNPSATGALTIAAATPMESGAGATRTLLDIAVNNGTDDRIQLLCTRITANGDWQGTIWRLRRIVNGFQQGIIEFGGGQIGNGSIVTINSAVPWTSANTTVDGNNFIKRA